MNQKFHCENCDLDFDEEELPRVKEPFDCGPGFFEVCIELACPKCGYDLCDTGKSFKPETKPLQQELFAVRR